MSEKKNERRLPPPVFPPGSRRHVSRNSTGSKGHARPPGSSFEGALISPDDPIPDDVDPMGAAFISPDDPMPERRVEWIGASSDARATATGDEPGEGEVVGMDLDPHLAPDEVVAHGDPHVMELTEAVAKLAESVRKKGEAGLRVRPDMTRFEATLRAYCVGYLAGRRAEDPPAPEVDEALPGDG